MSYLIKHTTCKTYSEALRTAKIIFENKKGPVVIYRAYTKVSKEDNHWVEDFIETPKETIATGQEHKK